MTEIGTSSSARERDVEPTVDQDFTPDMLALFNAHLEMVDKIAKFFARHVERHVALQELVAAGREGLFLAARRFDESRGVPFSVYANYRVRGAILDAVRHSNRTPRRVHERLRAMESATLLGEGEAAFVFHQRVSSAPEAEVEDFLDEHLATIATAATVALRRACSEASVSETSTSESPEEAYAQAEILGIIRAAVGDLDEVESRLVELMYFDGVTLNQASQSLGMSKAWACRLHARAMGRLTKRLRRGL